VQCGISISKKTATMDILLMKFKITIHKSCASEYCAVRYMKPKLAQIQYVIAVSVHLDYI